MSTFGLIVVVLLGLIVAGSAVGKLTKAKPAVDGLYAAGVKDAQVPVLAALELLGCAGLVVGIWVPWLGVLSAACLALYFLGAVVAQVRAKSGAAGILPPLVILAIAVTATLYLIGRLL